MSTAERLEELRDLPRVTGPQRAKYATIAVEMRKELGDWEPYHSHRERANSRLAQRAECVDLCPYSKASDGLSQTLLTIEHWRAHWRSLPDYDGPPMRAPSGAVVRFPAVEPIDEQRRSGRDDLREHVRSLGGERRAHFRDGARAYEAFGHMPPYAPPSEGGRGWCPGLAWVGK